MLFRSSSYLTQPIRWISVRYNPTNKTKQQNKTTKQNKNKNKNESKGMPTVVGKRPILIEENLAKLWIIATWNTQEQKIMLGVTRVQTKRNIPFKGLFCFLLSEKEQTFLKFCFLLTEKESKF